MDQKLSKEISKYMSELGKKSQAKYTPEERSARGKKAVQAREAKRHAKG